MASLDNKKVEIFAESDSALTTPFGFPDGQSTKDPAVLQTAEFLSGFITSLGLNDTAFKSQINTLNYLDSRQHAYLQQAGISGYLPNVEYPENAVILDNRKLYASVIPNNKGNPLTDINSWIMWLDLDNAIAKSTNYMPDLSKQYNVTKDAINEATTDGYIAYYAPVKWNGRAGIRVGLTADKVDIDVSSIQGSYYDGDNIRGGGTVPVSKGTFFTGLNPTRITWMQFIPIVGDE